MRAKNSSTSATVSSPSPCQPQYPSAQAASTGQSCTHISGGGVVVAPCSSRGSSFVSACFSASSPSVETSGSTPSRHTLRQLSIVLTPSGAARPLVPDHLKSPLCVIYVRTCLISNSFQRIFCIYFD